MIQPLYKGADLLQSPRFFPWIKHAGFYGQPKNTAGFVNKASLALAPRGLRARVLRRRTLRGALALFTKQLPCRSVTILFALILKPFKFTSYFRNLTLLNLPFQVRHYNRIQHFLIQELEILQQENLFAYYRKPCNFWSPITRHKVNKIISKIV